MSKTPRYASRVTQFTVAPIGGDIFDPETRIEIEDDGEGEYIVLKRVSEELDIRLPIDHDEWPLIREAIDDLIRTNATNDADMRTPTEASAYIRALIGEREAMKRDHHALLEQWNDIVRASGSRTHGGAVGVVAETRRACDRLAAENDQLRELLRRALLLIEHIPGAACLEVEMNKALDGDRSPDQEPAT